MKIGILTSFPSRGVAKSSIAYYAATIVDPLRDSADDFVIFADGDPQSPLGTSQAYASNVTVKRCWKFGYLAPFQILAATLRDRVNVLHLEYDVYLYGGVVAAVLLPFALRLLRRVRGTQIVTTLHGVVSQRVVTREMLRENGFVLPYSRIGRLGFQTIYRLFNWASDRIIVLEVELADILASDYGVPRSKIYVCPHPLMHEHVRPDVHEARRRCGIADGKVALFFGYASYYKGLELLIDAFSKARDRIPDLALHIVAGRHPRLRGNPRYESFYSALRDKASAAGAHMYDFVPESQLIDFLAAADVVVLPYTAAYGASGALNAVLAARKPVIVSTLVRFVGALDCQTFAPNPDGCASAIVDFFTENESTLVARVEEVAAMRDVAVIARQIQAVRSNRNEEELVPKGAVADLATARDEVKSR
ncbi:MAG: glycosyltransferase [Candidatus Eremiobacteraeota bacterium]|nr:glycosyltransferase [Candidatus Eremiobacteraeota bacterium]